MRRPWVRVLLAISGVGGVALAAWHQREALEAVTWTARPGLVALGVLLLAAGPLVQAATWLVALRRVGADAAWRPATQVWARSFLLRYEPSGAVGYAYRVGARERLGATTPQVLTASAYEQLGAVVAGAVAAPVAFLLAGLRPPLLSVLLAAAAVLVAVAARPRLLGGWVRDRLRARGVAMADVPRGRVLAAFVAAHGLGWAATAGGLALLAEACGIDVGTGLLTGAFALSWLLGVLVPLAPGGLGLRDGSLVVSLAATLGTGPATALAVALRAASFAGELVAVAVAEGLALLAPERVATTVRREALAARAGEPPAVAGARPSGRVIVVVPTYQEAAMLPLFVERFAATGLELLVVDDASPDGTGELADALAAERPWMHVLHRAGKDGLGAAYRSGFAWCLERGYRAVGQMDVDLSHPPEKLAEMLEVLDARGADLVLGSRYAPGGGTDGWSRARLALSRVGCTTSRLALGLPYGDLSGGFKLWRASCLADLGLEETLSAGYAFQVETTQLAHLLGKRIEEVPFVFAERVAGESKMSLAVSVEGVRVTFALRRRAREVAPARHVAPAR